ncbi:MAG: thermonuclease family protein [Myxococcales bacterium]|nr:thermonuclease family protein [Myxococcales bacterium]MCB9717139.1 thermonuclease family protein [Myxococcales bacterium]
MSRRRRALVPLVGLAMGLGLGLACGDGYECGPSDAVVERVIDGDTVLLDTGDRVRYLLVDTPEVTGDPECFGPEASDFNRSIVEGQKVHLSYDTECTDAYDRLLAYVTLPNGRVINELLLERGFACVLHIPPNGDDRADEYERIEEEAQAGLVGMWGQCVEASC